MDGGWVGMADISLDSLGRRQDLSRSSIWSSRPQIIEWLGKLPMGARLRIGFGAAALFAVADVLLLHPMFGDASGILAIVPVLVFAMLFGSAAGVLAGALALPFLMLTSVVLSEQTWLDWLWPAGLLGTGALVLSGAAVGKYRDLAAELWAARSAARAAAVSDPLRGAREPHVRTNSRATATARSRPVFAAPAESLTEREEDVLRLVAKGLPNKEIAETLGISLHTTKTHVSVILHKLSVSNRTGAVAVAREFDILD